MVSYRESLTKIGVAASEAVSHRAFVTRPSSLRETMRWMEAPKSNEWIKTNEVPLKSTDWTQKCNGVAWHNGYWIFSSNGSALSADKMGVISAAAGSPINLYQKKALYAFKPGTLRDKDVVHSFYFDDHFDWLDHIGEVASHDGQLYVSHFKDGQGSVFVLEHDESGFRFVRQIYLEPVSREAGGPPEKVELRAINPWDGTLYTSFGASPVDRFFIHDQTGAYTKRTFALKNHRIEGNDEDGEYPVQGAAFSSNGHFYVSSNLRIGEGGKFQPILYYSVLNGHHYGQIAIQAEHERKQELEGICCVGADLFAVVLETWTSEKDDIFFKTYTSVRPELV